MGLVEFLSPAQLELVESGVDHSNQRREDDGTCALERTAQTGKEKWCQSSPAGPRSKTMVWVLGWDGECGINRRERVLMRLLSGGAPGCTRKIITPACVGERKSNAVIITAVAKISAPSSRNCEHDPTWSAAAEQLRR